MMQKYLSRGIDFQFDIRRNSNFHSYLTRRSNEKTFISEAHEGRDDVIDRSTKTVQHSIKNISGNIKAVFLKLSTRNVHDKRK